MDVYHERDYIYFKDDSLNRVGQTNYTDELWEIISKVGWSIKRKQNGEPQYLCSGKLRKTLHQVVIDYYFGEEVRKKAYQKQMIIEHLNNDGLDCRISNLYFYLDVKNKYKGNYFDKLVEKSIPIVSLNVFHVLKNHTFQITIAFNAFFKNPGTGNYIHTLKLLYDYDYYTVLQDAESILEYILENMTLNIDQLQKKYRFRDYHIEYDSQIELTESEMKLPSGSAVMKDGQVYIIQRSDDIGRFYFLSTPYDDNWD